MRKKLLYSIIAFILTLVIVGCGPHAQPFAPVASYDAPGEAQTMAVEVEHEMIVDDEAYDMGTSNSGAANHSSVERLIGV